MGRQTLQRARGHQAPTSSAAISLLAGLLCAGRARYTPPSELLPLSYHREAAKLLEARAEDVARLRSASEWRARQQYILAELRNRTFAPLGLPKTPLNPVVTRRTHDPRGFELINLYFESRPGFMVTGTLFLPTARNGTVPGVVFSNGHWCLDHRDSTDVRQQNVILNTGALGIAVLAYDPIGQGERTQYLDPRTNRSAVGGCTFDPDTCTPVSVQNHHIVNRTFCPPLDRPKI